MSTRMWNIIRREVQYNPARDWALLLRKVSLINVKKIQVQLDPFYSGNESIRRLWVALESSRVRETNSKCKIIRELNNQRAPPQLIATLADDQRLIFKTEKIPSNDLLRLFVKYAVPPEAVQAK